MRKISTTRSSRLKLPFSTDFVNAKPPVWKSPPKLSTIESEARWRWSDAVVLRPLIPHDFAEKAAVFRNGARSKTAGGPGSFRNRQRICRHRAGRRESQGHGLAIFLEG